MNPSNANSILGKLDKEIFTSANFSVELPNIGPVEAEFKECVGLKREIETIDHWEVFPTTENVCTIIPGNLKSLEISLKNGTTSSGAFWYWMQGIVTGSGYGNWIDLCQNGSLKFYSQDTQEYAAFEFLNVYPSCCEAGTADVTQLEFAIQTITLVCTGAAFKRVAV
jgi:phage tail-like protein